MKTVIDCLVTLRAQFNPDVDGDNFSPTSWVTKSRSPHGGTSSHGHFSPLSAEERRKVLESKSQRALHSPVMSGIVVAGMCAQECEHMRTRACVSSCCTSPLWNCVLATNRNCRWINLEISCCFNTDADFPMF